MPRKYVDIGKFRSKTSDKIYTVKLSQVLLTSEMEYSCNCRGWIFNRKCKHTTFIKNHPFSKLIKLKYFMEHKKDFMEVPTEL